MNYGLKSTRAVLFPQILKKKITYKVVKQPSSTLIKVETGLLFILDQISFFHQNINWPTSFEKITFLLIILWPNYVTTGGAYSLSSNKR